MKGYISRNEAAKRLGVDPQTISNYCQQGLLAWKKKTISKQGGCSIWVEENSFKQMEDGFFIEFKSKGMNVNDICNSLHKDINELENKKAEIKTEVRALETAKRLTWMFARFANLYKFESISSRNLDIIRMFCKGISADVIAEKVSLSTSRIFQVIDNTFYKLMVESIKMQERVKELEKDNAMLTLRNLEMHKELSLNGDTRKEYRKQMNRQKQDLNNLKPDEERLVNLLCLPVNSLDLSVRAFNCMRSLNVKFVYDLINCSRLDLQKQRNMGKKTIDEISDMLESYGLGLNCPINGKITRCVEYRLGRELKN